MRSLHRYASDLMVVMVAVHLLREFAYDHYRGVRWFSWFTGVPIIWLLYASGITGYWLVWDKLAQYVALSTSELLDWLPIFGEPIARNFISTGTLTSRFFTLMVFMHVAVPLFLLFAMWVHILRISRPKVNPPRTARRHVAGRARRGVAVEAGAVAGPCRSRQGAGRDRPRLVLPAALSADRCTGATGAVWAFLGAFSLMIGADAVAAAAAAGEAGRGRSRALQRLCALRRGLPLRGDPDGAAGRDGLPFPTEAQVNPSLCVSCGICVGSCPSSTPFRRSEELKTGIDLPDYPLQELRERVIAAAPRPRARRRGS